MSKELLESRARNFIFEKIFEREKKKFISLISIDSWQQRNGINNGQS